MNEKLQELRKKAMALPLLPGVYIMHDKSGKIIYIGKAKALKNRVSQYFGSPKNHPEKVRRMVDHVDDFEYIITDSEFEALILDVLVQNKAGLHARPATFFIQKANEYKSSVWVEKEERRVNAKSLLGVLSLGIMGGTTIMVIADGSDEKEAVEGLVALIESGFAG